MPEVQLLEGRSYSDARGVVTVSEALEVGGERVTFLHECVVGSYGGVLRGLHYQTRQVQGKLLRVLRGEIFDVAVDVRAGSPTYGQWIGHSLSAASRSQLWIPPGFAHGYYVLGDWAEVLYRLTAPYDPAFEAVIRWDDPTLAIAWPLMTGRGVVLSERDRQGMSFEEVTPLVVPAVS